MGLANVYSWPEIISELDIFIYVMWCHLGSLFVCITYSHSEERMLSVVWFFFFPLMSLPAILITWLSIRKMFSLKALYPMVSLSNQVFCVVIKVMIQQQAEYLVFTVLGTREHQFSVMKFNKIWYELLQEHFYIL